VATAPTPAPTDRLSARLAPLLPWALGALVLASRLPFCASVAQDPDGARFVRALLRYDLAQGHPHPPGYPLFIALGAALHLVVPSPALSLSIVSALSLSALVALFTRWCIHRFGSLATALGVALLVLAPLSSTLSARPLSDMLGAALAWCALLSATRRPVDARHTAALSALVLLVRASTFALCAPALAAALALDRRHRASALGWIGLITALGYLPVVAATGPARFVSLVFHHGTGHFQRFGGSVITHPDLGARVRAFLWTLWTHGLGGPWSDRPTHLVVAGAIVSATSLIGVWHLVRAPASSSSRLVAAGVAVYGAWVFLGQNILWSPRHLLPIVPALAWCFASGVAALLRSQPRVALPVLLVGLASLAHESLRLSLIQRDEPPPTASIARWISLHARPPHSVIATAQLGPWLRGLTPTARVVDIEDARDLPRLRLAPTDRLFVTSEVHGAGTLGGRVRARFVRDRYVNPALYDLAIIELRR